MKLKCASCVYLTRLNFTDRPCDKLGKKTGTPACASFTPDYTLLANVAPNFLVALSYGLKHADQETYDLLRYMVATLGDIQKRSGYQFGQPVYINLSNNGKVALDSYYKAYVVGVSPDAQIIIASALENVGDKSSQQQLCTITVDSKRILTVTEFKDKAIKLIKAKLIEGGKRVEKIVLKEELQRSFEELDIPTIDYAPKQKHTKQKKVSLKNAKHIKITELDFSL
jgi:hypothetical protein